jgi:hypothetical protein
MSEFVKKAVSSIGGRLHRKHSTRAIWRAVWVVLVTSLTYYALFRLPFRFPPQTRLWSASYAFGFNNGVAIIGLAGLLGLVALVRLFGKTSTIQLPIKFGFQQPVGISRSLAIVFAIGCFLYAGLTFAFYLYNRHSAPSLTWETRHFLHRTWLMDLYGRRAYTDFSTEYGPILTYTPLWTYRALKPLGLSYEGAYFICHLLLNLVGLSCAYYLFARATMPSQARVFGLMVIAVAGFAPYMGLNGVLVRYLFPFASLLLGHRVISRAQRWTGVRFWLQTVVMVMVLVAANVLLSPEVGISFALAWLCYALLRARRNYKVIQASLLALAATALLCWRFLPSDYYSSLIHFSEGANNLPLLPAAHLIFYLLTMFLVVPPLLAAGVAKSNALDVPAAALCGALGVLCLVMAPGALGRCDPPHVLFYGMGASILLMIRLANGNWRVFVAYTFGYAAVFIILLQLINLRVFYGVSPKELLSPNAIAHLRRGLHSAARTDHPSAATLTKLNKYPHLALPYATFGDPTVEKYIVLRGELHPEYYIAIVGVYNAAALQRKLSDVSKAQYLLMPSRFMSESASKPCRDYLISLKRWFFYPAKLPCRAEPLDPGAELKSFISRHYTVAERIDHWMILRRTPD